MVNIQGIPPKPMGSKEPEAIEPIIVPEGPMYPDLDLTNKQRLFLKVYTIEGTVMRAARTCKMTARLHYFWLTEGTNREAYRTGFERAELETLAILEDEAFRRAVQGTARPIFYKGEKVGSNLEFDSMLLLRLMEAKGDKYTPRSKGSHSVAGVTLDQLARNVFENLKDD